MTNIIEYTVCSYCFCMIFKTYEEAWRYTEAQFNDTGKILCVEPIYA